MGSCVSLNRNSESAMKHRLWSKNKKLVIPSPVKETAGAGAPTVSDVLNKSQVSSARFSGGSRDEAFFDSQPWLESDCEDDFLSVNGDFTTPSRGSTPVHHSRIEEEENEIPPDDLSTPDKKKRLSQLFIESLRAEEENKEDSSPSKSKASYVVTTEDRSDVKCCFVSNRSFSDKKTRMSH